SLRGGVGGAPGLAGAAAPGFAGVAGAAAAGFAGAGAGMGAGLSACVRRKASRLMRSSALCRPAKLILVPGTTACGDFRYLNSASKVHGVCSELIALQ